MPAMFRWILDDTRALLADIRSLGRRFSTRIQWWRMKSGHRMTSAAADLENVRRMAQSRTRMCRACRALISVDARTCPECGGVPGRSVSKGFLRVLESITPNFVSASSVILTLNCAVYALCTMVSSRLDVPPAARLDPWSQTLLALGANSFFPVVHGEVWRLLTMVFLHGNLVHLLFNCWALMAVGPLLEQTYGPRKFLLFYVATGVAGSAASLAWNLEGLGIGVGASGAVFGLIGAAAVWGWRRGGTIGASIRGQMIQWAVYALVFALIMRADNAAHLGGMACGALLALSINDGEPGTAAGARFWDVIAYFCVLLFLASFGMVALRFQDVLTEMSRFL